MSIYLQVNVNVNVNGYRIVSVLAPLSSVLENIRDRASAFPFFDPGRNVREKLKRPKNKA